MTIPHHGGFPLIRDAHRSDVIPCDIRNRFRNHRLYIAQDLDRIVFDPTGMREQLRMLALRDGNHVATVIEQHCARTRSALIDGQHELRHEDS